MVMKRRGKYGKELSLSIEKQQLNRECGEDRRTNGSLVAAVAAARERRSCYVAFLVSSVTRSALKQLDSTLLKSNDHSFMNSV